MPPRGKGKAASPKAPPGGPAEAAARAAAPPPCQGHNTMLLGRVSEMTNAILNHPAFEAVQNLPPHALGAGGSQELRIKLRLRTSVACAIPTACASNQHIC